MEDITGLGQIATAAASITNNFIDKISNAVGVVYTDSTYKIKQDALKKVYTKIANDDDLDNFTKGAIISTFKQDLKHYNNQRNILEKAMELIDADADMEIVDDDWLMFFFDKAKNVSSDEMQNVWSKILSEEFNRPCSIPKSLLHTVSCIDLKLANVFNSLCQFTAIHESEGLYVIIMLNKFEDELKKYDLTFETLTELDRYGLISFTTISNFVFGKENEVKKIYTSNHEFTVKPNTNGYIPIGDVIFTIDGIALCDCIEKKENPLIIEMIHELCGDLIIEDKKRDS